MYRSTRSLRRIGHHSKRFVSYNLPAIRLLDLLNQSNINGLPGLFSKKTVEELWFSRGQHLVDNLNGQIFKQKVENAPLNLEELINVSFLKPDLQELFTNASLLHNLQFFLESLKSNESRSYGETDISALFETPNISVNVENVPRDAALSEWIVDSFGSMIEFKTLLLNSAASIKGDGVTWLIAQATYSESAMRDGAKNGPSFDTLAIMNTYNAGIVDDSMRSGQITKMKYQKLAKSEAAQRRVLERKELEGQDQELVVAAEEVQKPSALDDNFLGSIEEAEESHLYFDRKLVPLLAIDSSMRTYLQDYGVYGKRKYLENVWHCLDWDIVASRAPPRFKPSMVFEY